MVNRKAQHVWAAHGCFMTLQDCAPSTMWTFTSFCTVQLLPGNCTYMERFAGSPPQAWVGADAWLTAYKSFSLCNWMSRELAPASSSLNNGCRSVTKATASRTDVAERHIGSLHPAQLTAEPVVVVKTPKYVTIADISTRYCTSYWCAQHPVGIERWGLLWQHARTYRESTQTYRIPRNAPPYVPELGSW